jgi:hypothetical protein
LIRLRQARITVGLSVHAPSVVGWPSWWPKRFCRMSKYLIAMSAIATASLGLPVKSSSSMKTLARSVA